MDKKGIFVVTSLKEVSTNPPVLALLRNKDYYTLYTTDRGKQIGSVLGK